MAEGEKRKTCFVIAPIGDEGTEIRQRSDQVLTHIINPTANECGYETIRADKISEPGIISLRRVDSALDSLEEEEPDLERVEIARRFAHRSMRLLEVVAEQLDMSRDLVRHMRRYDARVK